MGSVPSTSSSNGYQIPFDPLPRRPEQVNPSALDPTPYPAGKSQGETTFRIRERHFYNIKSTTILQKDELTCNVTGITQLPDESIVLVDSMNCKVKLLDKTFKIVSQIRLPDWPMDVCISTDDIAAVTVCDKRQRHEVHFISVKNNDLKTEKMFKLNHECSAIGSHDGYLYIGSFDTVFKYKPCGQLAAIVFQNRVEDNYFPTVQRLKINRQLNTMFVTDYRNNKIRILDLKGEQPKRSIRRPELAFPTGVSVTTKGHIFVCCCKNSVIMHVNDTDEDANIIATHADGVYRPEAIHFDEKTNSLIVGQSGDNLIVFFLEFCAA
ncbi:uncharacterized protein LOC127841993 [Dreissena polymorpha]|uniref:Uncharacterized protein n=1 Tax=Dreissena polymorpha TaxID=45954 RepID=A0A9D4EXD9_DREPO|nr:uncharacterized protein LOC127841993 [Dreissena polymorpha]KAH3787591.1 hypothetical protein DPMN_165717 [Dreissena polymorpha]